jgi:predicted dienelactone hydrolase
MSALKRALSVVAMLAVSAASVRAAVPSAADVSRAVALLFAGDLGVPSGDVNADGQANAADVCGVLRGWRSPTQPGPYGVGLRRIVFTKASVTNPLEQRVLNTDVWYPAPPGAGPIDRRPGGQSNAPLADGLSHLPLVLFSHGSCGFQEQSIFLTSTLASYGFVVAAPPHPGNSTAEILTCGTQAAVQDSFDNRPADIIFVIDSLLALNDDPTSFFYQTIDPNRIGMSGHSYGGLTTLRVGAMDPRVVAGLALAPVARSIQDEVREIAIPIMIQVGALDGLLVDARLAYDLLKAPRYRLEIQNMTHSPFADVCLECTATSLSPAQAHPFILRYAIPYMLHYVAGDTRFDAFLATGATLPGVEWTSDVMETGAL